MLQFSRRDDLQNTDFDPGRLKIVDLFGPLFLFRFLRNETVLFSVQG